MAKQVLVNNPTRTATLYSGALAPAVTGAPGAVATAGHVILFSGAGTLISARAHQAISGVQANFYDSDRVARSGVGTIQESGYKILGNVPANTWNPLAAALTGVVGPIDLTIPFSSGLAVSFPSGCAGITVAFSPEVP